MREIQIDVKNEYVLGDGCVIGAAGSGLDTALSVSFGSEWDGFSKEIEWHDARGLEPKIVEITDGMLNADGRYAVPIPYEAKAYAGIAACAFRGTKTEGGVEITVMTGAASFRVLESLWEDVEEE